MELKELPLFTVQGIMASTQFLVYTNVQKFDPLRLLTSSIFFCKWSQAEKVPDMDKWSNRDSIDGPEIRPKI